jgi:hypothetical protein
MMGSGMGLAQTVDDTDLNADTAQKTAVPLGTVPFLGQRPKEPPKTTPDKPKNMINNAEDETKNMPDATNKASAASKPINKATDMQNNSENENTMGTPEPVIPQREEQPSSTTEQPKDEEDLIRGY